MKETAKDLRACWDFVRDYFEYIPAYLKVFPMRKWPGVFASAFRVSCSCAKAREKLQTQDK